MDIKRDKRINSGAFTGSFYVVSRDTGLAIESWSTAERANYACAILNEHNQRNGHAERFGIQEDESERI